MAVSVTAKANSNTYPVRPYAVICDWGERAAVAVLHLPHPPQPGLQFSAFGMAWEVVAAGTPSRGPVARPLARSR